MMLHMDGAVYLYLCLVVVSFYLGPDLEIKTVVTIGGSYITQWNKVDVMV